MSLQGTLTTAQFPVHRAASVAAGPSAAKAVERPETHDRAPRAANFRRHVYCLLGLPFDAIDSAGAVSVIREAVQSRVPLFLSTPNLDFLTMSQRDSAFRRSVVRSDLSVCDGMPLVWIARLIGIPITRRVTGSDLFESIRRGDGGPIQVFFFGGPAGVAEIARQNINQSPGPMRCVGGISPGFGTVAELSSDETIATINASKADFVIVALGGQKGQAWIEHNRHRLEAPITSHLGAVINFAAERVSRAPKIIQRAGFEWLWRIKEEPSLWRRYRDNAVLLASLLMLHVAPLMLANRLASGKSRSPARLTAAAEPNGDAVVTLSGGWHESDLPPLQAALETAVITSRAIVLDLSGLDHCDSAFIGLLMLVYGHQSNERKGLRIVAPSARVRRLFRLHCALYLLEEPARPQSSGTDER